MTDRKYYEENLKAKLDEWQANIDKMRAKARQAEVESRKQMEEEIDKLRTRRDEMVDQLEKLQKSNENAWTEVKTGVEKAWKDMNEAVDRARKHYS
jgi:predicted nuclease with TOPRIM domain